MSLETQKFEFGDYLLDRREKRLVRRDGTPVPLTPKAFALLLVLVENYGRLLEKNELLEKIWADSVVEEGNLAFTIRMLRKNLGDDSRRPRYIETVPKRGYRFVAAVRAIDEADAGEGSAARASSPPPNSEPERQSDAATTIEAEIQTPPNADRAIFRQIVSPSSLDFSAPKLYGRAGETSQIDGLLRRAEIRLVTLVGVGGCGKTALARAAAGAAADDFPDGVFFVELAAIFNPELLIPAIAQTIGVKETSGQPLAETLRGFLAERRVLLILDNFEQIAAAAVAVAGLLRATRHLKALVTSRTPLRIEGESELIVPPLAAPRPDAAQISAAAARDFPSVEMFVARARAVRPNFELADENAAFVAEICARLDGLPLAIELAAARVRLLTPAAILERLTANPLSILTSRVANLPARQQTMRETIAWSYELLGETQKSVFARLAVFVGGFTPAAAEAICADDGSSGDAGGGRVLDDLESLLGDNLLQPFEAGGEMRLRMLETIREFAVEKLYETGEAETRRARHAEYFLDLAKSVERELMGARQALLLARLEADAENFRAALERFRGAEPDKELRLAAALAPYWTFRGDLGEGIERLTAALEANPRAEPAARARALTWLGQLIWVKGDYVRAIAVCEESLQLARQADYPIFAALSHFVLGMSHWYRHHDAPRAVSHLEESLRLYRAQDYQPGVVFTLVVIAAIHQSNDDLVRAESLLAESLAAAEKTGSNLSLSIALVNYGRLEAAKGNLGKAKQMCLESLRLRGELEDRWGLVQCLEPLAAVALREGRARRAARLLGAVDVLLESLGASPPLIFRADHEPTAARARRLLPPAVFAAEFAAGRRLSAREVVALAFDESGGRPEPDDDYAADSEDIPDGRGDDAGSPPTTIPRPARATRARSIAAAIAVCAVAFGGWLIVKRFLRLTAPVLSAPFASEKISTGGNVKLAEISADGQNAAYVVGTGSEDESLWLRQLESGNNVEIIGPSAHSYGGLAFSPDGNFIYFCRKAKFDENHFDVYRIPIFGGVPTKIVGATQGWISVAPDGATISFVRCPQRAEENCSLWTAAAADGRGERKHVARPAPLRIADNRFSPDGRRIAFAVGQSENLGNEFALAEIDLESGAERLLTEEKFYNIKRLAYLPDGGGLLMTASRTATRIYRIWRINAAGEASALTKDAESYESLSIDRSGARIVMTQVKDDYRLLVLRAADASQKRLLAKATAAAIAPRGKIYFSSPLSGNDEIWSIDADGSRQTQLTSDAADDFRPIVAPTDGSVFFASNRTGAVQVWRMNADGSDQTQITREHGGFPVSISPDGETLFYHHGRDRTLWRVALASGAESPALGSLKSRRFAVAPDGSAAVYADRENGEPVLRVASLADGRIVETFRTAEKKYPPTDFVWLPDGRALAYVVANPEIKNNGLWLQPLDGEPRRLCDLNDQEANEPSGLAVAPDGEIYVVVIGRWLHDAVLVKGLQ